MCSLILVSLRVFGLRFPPFLFFSLSASTSYFALVPECIAAMRALLARGVCCSFAALALALCSSSSLSSVLSLSLSLLLPLSLLLLLLLLLSLLLLLLLLSLIKLSLLLLLPSRVVSGNTRGRAAGRRGELAALDAPCCSAVCAACNAGKLSIMQLQASLFCAISGQLVPTVMRSVLMPAYRSAL